MSPDYTEVLANIPPKKRDEILNAMKPEIAEKYRAALGIKVKAWESFGLSRATYFRTKQMLAHAPSLEHYEAGKKALQSGVEVSEVRRAAGAGPVNSPISRARSSIRAVDDGTLLALVTEEVSRRLKQELTLAQVGALLYELGQEESLT